MPLRHRSAAGFSLLEVLLVVTIVGILAAIVLPSAQPSVYDQLRSTARIAATDLAYARSLAVAYNDKYTITFDTKGNRYVLKHSGANAALNTLPVTPFSAPGDTTTEHAVALDDLPHVGPTVRLIAAATFGTAYQQVSSVEFGPLGQTTKTDPTIVWLASGDGDATRYITLRVDAVTGIAEVGDFGNVGPPSEALPTN